MLLARSCSSSCSSGSSTRSRCCTRRRSSSTRCAAAGSWTWTKWRRWRGRWAARGAWTQRGAGTLGRREVMVTCRCRFLGDFFSVRWDGGGGEGGDERAGETGPAAGEGHSCYQGNNIRSERGQVQRPTCSMYRSPNAKPCCDLWPCSYRPGGEAAWSA